jgi:hypothetical protein
VAVGGTKSKVGDFVCFAWLEQISGKILLTYLSLLEDGLGRHRRERKCPHQLFRKTFG